MKFLDKTMSLITRINCILILTLMKIQIAFSSTNVNCANFTQTCECFDDFELEIQCPNSESYEKILIRLENWHHVKVECWNTRNQQFPQLNFPPTISQLSIVECPITNGLSKMFNVNNLNRILIENTVLDDAYFFENNDFERLNRLYVKDTRIEVKIKLNSKLLTSLDFEGINDETSMRNAAEMFKQNSNLLEINLSFNNLARLTPKTIFSNLTSLEILHLSRNNLESLPSNIFEDLHNLKVLNLDVNDLEKLPEELFENLERLHSLDISNNNLGELTQTLMAPLQNSLQVFYADHNAKLNLASNLFNNFKVLEILTLSHSNLRQLPSKMFENCTKLSQISLENNHLSGLPSTIFEGLTNLKQLRLDNNKIEQIEDGTFDSLQNLEILQLQNNQLVKLSENLLINMIKLKELNLEFNKIQKISENVFRNVGNSLEKLHFGNNQLEYEIQIGHFGIAENPFKKCVNLKFLDLNHNNLMDLIDDVFLFAKSLRYLDLRHNKISWIDLTSLWKIADKGVLLNLEYNQISRFFIEPNRVEELNNQHLYDYDNYDEDEDDEFGEEDSIVSISNNPLICDCYAETLREFLVNSPSKDVGLYFKYDQLYCNSTRRKLTQINPEELTCKLDELLEMPYCTNSSACECFWRPNDKSLVVNCSKKNLEDVPTIFLPTNLVEFNQTEVHLEGNQLKNAPSYSPEFENVTKMFLGNNQIVEINWTPSKIQILDLSNNLIENLPNSLVERLNRSSSLKNLTLANNPWKCTCEQAKLLEFLQENAAKLDAANILCGNEKMIKLNPTILCGNPTIISMISIIVLCVIASIILLLLMGYYKYRQEIHVWLYAKNLCNIFLNNANQELSDKKYDIFISYSHKDEEFVVEELVKVLENSKNNYKVCLHFRDWIPGDLIAENIANSVANSRKTLVVLTKSFLESVWGKMEFRTAHAEALKEHDNRVILVVKDPEDIEFDLLDDELKCYIATNTFLKWKDEWFWEKLEYALSRRCKPPKITETV